MYKATKDLNESELRGIDGGANCEPNLPRPPRMASADALCARGTTVARHIPVIFGTGEPVEASVSDGNYTPIC